MPLSPRDLREKYAAQKNEAANFVIKSIDDYLTRSFRPGRDRYQFLVNLPRGTRIEDLTPITEAYMKAGWTEIQVFPRYGASEVEVYLRCA